MHSRLRPPLPRHASTSRYELVFSSRSVAQHPPGTSGQSFARPKPSAGLGRGFDPRPTQMSNGGPRNRHGDSSLGCTKAVSMPRTGYEPLSNGCEPWRDLEARPPHHASEHELRRSTDPGTGTSAATASATGAPTTVETGTIPAQAPSS